MKCSSTAPLLCVLTLGCTWSPASGTPHENTATVSLSGWATDQTEPIVIKARNYDTGALDLIKNVNPTSSDLFGDGMVSWSTTVTAAQLPRKYWAPTSVGGNPSGRLEINAFEDGYPVYTFTQAAKDCTITELNNGATQPNAGATCSDGVTTVLFDNSGVGLAAEAVGYAPIVNKTVSGVNVKVISYLSQGLTVYAAVCSPLAGSGHPIAIYNHGGMGGINPDVMGMPTQFETDWCITWAQQGWVFGMSSYRGEALRVPASWSVAPTSWLSTGAVEANLGEVNDVMRLLSIVQAMPGVDVNHTLMWGGSHGGGITLRAVEQGAKVQAAIASFPATEWIQLYNDCVATTSGDPTSLAGQFCAIVTAMLDTVTGGPPASHAAAYQWRSPTYFAADLKMRGDVKILLQQGISDPIVRVSQTCAFAQQAGFPSATQWHVPNNLVPGSSNPAPVAGCPQAWQAGARPTGAWPESRYFMVYDGVEHSYGDAMTVDFLNFLNALLW